MYRNLIFSGGSIKGLCAFIGAVKALEEKDKMKHFNTFIGASAGAVISFMICCGMSSRNMVDFFQQEMNRYQTQDANIDNLLNIIDTMGVDDGKFVYESFIKILKFRFPSREEVSFMDLMKSTGKHLVICGSNLTQVKTEYFSIETTPEMNVLDALRISISLPFIFPPFVYNDNVYADAGLFNNFPIDYIKDEMLKTTLGICINNKEQKYDLKELNLIRYIDILMNTIFYKMNEKREIVDHHVIEIMFSNNDPYNFDLDSFKFKINQEDITSFIQNGYDSTMSSTFLHKI